MLSSKDELLLNANIAAISDDNDRVSFRLLEHYLNLEPKLVETVWFSAWDKIFDRLQIPKPVGSTKVSYLPKREGEGKKPFAIKHPEIEIHLSKITFISLSRKIQRINIDGVSKPIIELGERFLVVDKEYGSFTGKGIFITFLMDSGLYANAYFNSSVPILGR